MSRTKSKYTVSFAAGCQLGREGADAALAFAKRFNAKLPNRAKISFNASSVFRGSLASGYIIGLRMTQAA